MDHSSAPVSAAAVTGIGPRVVTALVLIALVVVTLWFGSTQLLAGIFGIFLLLAAHEWAGLVGLGRVGRLSYAGATALLSAGLALMLMRGLDVRLAAWVAVSWWGMACAVIVAAQQGRNLLPSSLAVLLVIGWLILLPCYAALLLLHAASHSLLLGLMVLIWSADTAAFFAGRAWGVRRLASRVSPGKTWAGAIAALAAGALIGVGIMVGLDPAAGSVGSRAGAVALSGSVVVAASIVGDLFESLMKRRRGIKDSGALLPGHGGILDRIDSLLAAAPVYALGFAPLVSP